MKYMQNNGASISHKKHLTEVAEFEWDAVYIKQNNTSSNIEDWEYCKIIPLNIECKY